MTRPAATTIVTYSLLMLTAGAAILLPQSLVFEHAAATEKPKVVRLNGVARDFRPTHPDFDVDPSEAPGHIVNLVEPTIGENNRPVFDGSGHRVITQARDVQGRNIAPVMTSLDDGIEFTISDGKVIAKEAFAARITVIGAAISASGAYDMPVTLKVNIGGETIHPFGSFTSALAGNVNKAGNPREYTSPHQYAANTAIYVTGRSWVKKSSSYSGNSESHWETSLEYNTSSATPQIKVLRNGDSAPNTAGFMSQLAAKEFLLPYIDPVSQKVTLTDNQVIYLFELGTTSLNSSAADFQDLVVLLTMAKSPDVLGDDMPSNNTCGPKDDTPGTFDATPTAAGITSAETFSSWFRDVPGTNLSSRAQLDLVHDGSKYVFDDQHDSWYSRAGGFYPADSAMFNDADASGHDSSFTFNFDARFTYDAAAEQYFTTTTDMEVWVFIDGKLVIDLGGFHAATSQRVDLSRLCLEDGKTYNLQFFLAHRYAPSSHLRIETNIDFVGAPTVQVTTAGD